MDEPKNETAKLLQAGTCPSCSEPIQEIRGNVFHCKFCTATFYYGVVNKEGAELSDVKQWQKSKETQVILKVDDVEKGEDDNE